MCLLSIHHIAIICSDYIRSKQFYSEILGLKVIRETFRESRASYKLDLELPDGSQIELFSFPNPPQRASRPEAQGLRHLAFEVANVDELVKYLNERGVVTEPVRIDELTGKKFTFFVDPDDLPLEVYEQ